MKIFIFLLGMVFWTPLLSYGELSATLSLHNTVEEEKLKSASLIELKIAIQGNDKQDKWLLSMDEGGKWVSHGSILINKYDLEGDGKTHIILKALVLSDEEVFIPPIPIRREASDEIVKTNRLILSSSSRISPNEKPKWVEPLMNYGDQNTNMIIFISILALAFLSATVFYLKRRFFGTSKAMEIDRKKYVKEKTIELLRNIKRKNTLNTEEIKKHSYSLTYFTKVYLSEISKKNLLDFTDKELASFFLKSSLNGRKFSKVKDIFSDTYEVRYGNAYIDKNHFSELIGKLSSLISDEEKLESRKDK